MKLLEYRELSVRTNKDPMIVMSELNGDKINLLHASTGLSSEYTELAKATLIIDDRPNTIEEIGDICWYLSLILEVYPQISVDADLGTAPKNTASAVSNIGLFIGNVSGLIKSHVFYNKDMDVAALSKNVNKVFSLCNHLLKTFYASDIESAFDSNIFKLKQRYPSTYSDDAAIARADVHKSKQQIAKVILESAFRTTRMPENIQQMETLLEEHPESVVDFPEDVKEFIIDTLGFDPSESKRIQFKGVIGEGGHSI